MAGCFPAAPVTNDWQGFDQRLSEIELPWGANPATRGINTAGKWKCLERLAVLVKGRLVPKAEVGHLESGRSGTPSQLFMQLTK